MFGQGDQHAFTGMLAGSADPAGLSIE